MRRDCHCWVGSYPYRRLPAGDVDALLRDMDALELDEAWVGDLAAPFGDLAPEPTALSRLLAPHRGRLHPVPTLDPRWGALEVQLGRAVDDGAAAVRAYPMHWPTVAPDALAAVTSQTGAVGLPLILTVQFEDVRQRPPEDRAPNLDPATVRLVARSLAGTGALIVAAAGRAFIEEVHWSLTPSESAGVFWDISHVWGPPEDDLAHLVHTIGAEHLVLGTHWPLRIRDAALARLDLLDDPVVAAVIASASGVLERRRP